jgi:hypothetical protein
MAEAYFPIEVKIKQKTLNRLPREFVDVFYRFLEKTDQLKEDQVIFDSYQPPKFSNVQ